jgi:hypothetical protein
MLAIAPVTQASPISACRKTHFKSPTTHISCFLLLPPRCLAYSRGHIGPRLRLAPCRVIITDVSDQLSASVLDPEDGGSKLLRNICKYESTRHHIPGDFNLQQNRCETLKSWALCHHYEDPVTEYWLGRPFIARIICNTQIHCVGKLQTSFGRSTGWEGRSKVCGRSWSELHRVCGARASCIGRTGSSWPCASHCYVLPRLP